MILVVPSQSRRASARASGHIRHCAGLRVWLLPLWLVASVSVWAIPGDRERAELLVRQGRDLLAQPAEARRYAERALEFMEDHPDALVLLGRAAAAEGRWDTAASDLDRALHAGELRVFRTEETRTLLAEALLRMRRAEDAIQALSPLGPASEADALLLGAKAARALGQTDAARRYLLDASRLHPDLAEAWTELASLELSLNRFAESRAALQAGRSHLPVDARLALAQVSEEWTTEGRARALTDYLALSDRPPELDAKAAVLGVQYDPANAPTYLDVFLEADGLRYGRQLAQMSAELADHADLVARLGQAAAAWTGIRRLDADGDGVPEYRYKLSSGTLTGWGADPDQDGAEEVTVELGEDGHVHHAVIGDLGSPARPEDTVTLDYGVYPWVVAARFPWPMGYRVYDLVPMAYRLRLTEGAVSASSRLVDGFRPPRESEIRASSRAYRNYRVAGAAGQQNAASASPMAQGNAPAEGTLVAVASLRDGQLVRVEADADGDGVREHVVRYSGGLPDRGERDLDTNGVYETQEYYEAGALERIEIDTNGDGRADYVRRPGEPGMDAWDLDNDGELDTEHIVTVLSQLRRLYGSLTGSRTQ